MVTRSVLLGLELRKKQTEMSSNNGQQQGEQHATDGISAAPPEQEGTSARSSWYTQFTDDAGEQLSSIFKGDRMTNVVRADVANEDGCVQKINVRCTDMFERIEECISDRDDHVGITRLVNETMGDGGHMDVLMGFAKETGERLQLDDKAVISNVDAMRENVVGVFVDNVGPKIIQLVKDECADMKDDIARIHAGGMYKVTEEANAMKKQRDAYMCTVNSLKDEVRDLNAMVSRLDHEIKDITISSGERILDLESQITSMVEKVKELIDTDADPDEKERSAAISLFESSMSRLNALEMQRDGNRINKEKLKSLEIKINSEEKSLMGDMTMAQLEEYIKSGDSDKQVLNQKILDTMAEKLKVLKADDEEIVRGEVRVVFDAYKLRTNTHAKNMQEVKKENLGWPRNPTGPPNARVGVELESTMQTLMATYAMDMIKLIPLIKRMFTVRDEGNVCWSAPTAGLLCADGSGVQEYSALHDGIVCESEKLFHALWKLDRDAVKFAMRSKIYTGADGSETMVTGVKGDGLSILNFINQWHSRFTYMDKAKYKKLLSNMAAMFEKGDIIKACNKIRYFVEPAIKLKIKIEYQLTVQASLRILQDRSTLFISLKEMNEYINLPAGIKEDDCLSIVPEFLTRVIKTAGNISEEVGEARVRDSLSSRDTFEAMYCMLSSAESGDSEHSAHLVKVETVEMAALVEPKDGHGKKSRFVCDGIRGGVKCNAKIP